MLSDCGDSLLLAALVTLLLALAGDNFAKHDNTVAVHESHPDKKKSKL